MLCSVHAEFTGVINNCTVNFFDLSTTGASTVITSWGYDFGDGSTPVYTQNAIHTYSSSGSYNVCLKVVGDDGRNTCSDVICHKIDIDCEMPRFGNGSYQLIPNPTKGSFKLYVNAGKDEEASVLIFDMYGKELKDQHVNFRQGFNQFDYDMQGASEGIYFVKIIKADEQTVLKLILVH